MIKVIKESVRVQIYLLAKSLTYSRLFALLQFWPNDSKASEWRNVQWYFSSKDHFSFSFI